jgi:predicted  nucleic acid-binding Zn-ribbon protein
MADEPMNLTVRVLKQIRDEVRRTNDRLDATNERLDATNERLDATNERLEQMHAGLSQRIVESEVRTATAISELAVSVRDMTSVLRAQNDLRPRVDRCERDIAELKGRLSG